MIYRPRTPLTTVLAASAAVLGVLGAAVVGARLFGNDSEPASVPPSRPYTGLEAGTPAHAFALMLDDASGGRLGPWEWTYAPYMGADVATQRSGLVQGLFDSSDPSSYHLACLWGGRDQQQAKKSGTHHLTSAVAGTDGAAATSMVGQYASRAAAVQAVESTSRVVDRCASAENPEPLTANGGRVTGFSTEIRLSELPHYTQHTVVALVRNRVGLLVLNTPDTVTLDSQAIFTALAPYAGNDLNLREDRLRDFTGGDG